MKNIGKRLKNAIKNSKYTQKEISKLLNTSQNTLSSYMQGKASITVETLRDICDIIEVPIQEIIYEINYNNFDEMIFNKIKKLNNNQKKVIIAQIEFLENQNKQKSLDLKNTENIGKEKNDTG